MLVPNDPPSETPSCKEWRMSLYTSNSSTKDFYGIERDFETDHPLEIVSGEIARGDESRELREEEGGGGKDGEISPIDAGLLARKWQRQGLRRRKESQGLDVAMSHGSPKAAAFAFDNLLKSLELPHTEPHDYHSATRGRSVIDQDREGGAREPSTMEQNVERIDVGFAGCPSKFFNDWIFTARHADSDAVKLEGALQDVVQRGYCEIVRDGKEGRGAVGKMNIYICVYKYIYIHIYVYICVCIYIFICI